MALTVTPSERLAAQSVVDHTAYQTPQHGQGGRTTCITFAAVAAVEARYRRLGQDLDLSEEFVNYLRKVFWLHPSWSDIQAGGADEAENQLGSSGGGSGVSVLEWLTRGLAAPLEQYFPYRETNYATPYPWNDPHWDSQYNTNTWNLDPDNLPRAALKAPGYYYATGFHKINQPNSAAAIEAVLAAGYEVVWDFNVAGDRSGDIWRASSSPSIGGHSMLIIGYDKSSSDPNDHHFICKNSWEPTGLPNDWTHIGYDYIQYGYNAAYVTGAAPTPRPWPELQLLGRRKIRYDGWPGTLDIYHIPGIGQMNLDQLANGITDRRVGSFYDHNGVAHRVNGFAYGTTLQFWFKGSSRNMRWDEERETPTLGRNFVYRVVNTGTSEMAGRHHDNAGLTPNPAYAGYARMPSSMLANDGDLQPAVPGSPNTPEQWLGSWELRTGDAVRKVRFTHRDDSLLPLSQQPTYAAIVGHVRTSSISTTPVMMRVTKSSPRTISLTYTDPYYGPIEIDGWQLTWQRGVAAGLATVNLADAAFYMVRQGNYTEGHKTPFGGSCGPPNGAPYHTVQGHAELNQPLWFNAVNLDHYDIAVLAIGLSNTTSGGAPLPASLDGIGMPGCNLYVDPVILDFDVANSQGVADRSIYFSQAGLLGQHLYSQWFVLKPGANAAGLLSTNGYDLEMGAVW